MDLRAYGSSFDEAFSELLELVEMQVNFSQYKRDPQLLWRKAEPQHWETFAPAS